MSGFTSRAACSGRRPPQFTSYDGFSRPQLIAQLLKERSVARFIVAPSGYGKSTLAFEYADTVFSWAHVFWVNGASPCFIRDLDAQTLAHDIVGVDPEARLVVIDGLPALDGARAQLASAQIDDLLDAGCEVIVTCVPSSDIAGDFQIDRIRLSARDLLLDDEELDRLRSSDERLRKAVGQLGARFRVPALAWGNDRDAAASFCKAAMQEALPADLMLAQGCIYVLRRGAVASLCDLGSFDAEMLAELLEDYPHLGYDPESSRFEAPSFAIADIAAAFRGCFDSLMERSSFDSKTGLVTAWARILMEESDDPARACEVVRVMCPRSDRAAWLFDHAYQLVKRACFFSAWRLACEIDGAQAPAKDHVCALRALCLRVLGDEDRAIFYAKRVAFDRGAAPEARACALLVVARFAVGTVREQACKLLEEEVSGNTKLLSGGMGFWRTLATAWCAYQSGADALGRFWQNAAGHGAPRDALLVVASWLFASYAGDVKPDDSPSFQDARSLPVGWDEAERFTRDQLGDVELSDLDYFAASAGLAFEDARMRSSRMISGPLDTPELIALRKVEMSVFSQRRQYDQAVDDERTRRAQMASENPDAYWGGRGLPASAQPPRAIPVLSLKFFGKFEVSIGDRLIAQQDFKRQNTRALLVLLAVNHGREVSRDALSASLWPNSSQEVARKNFYTIWAQLRRVLSLPDGSCPYLVRHQYGCSLETRYVHSDVERLDAICRELLFGKPNVEQWASLYAEIDRDYSGELMVCERKNPLVIQARNDYRSRLVDALVGASDGVLRIDNPQWAIWFARAALGHDDVREDAYAALMRAQIENDQRTEAMATYLKCRRILSERLGVDPAPGITSLYGDLLDSE